VVTTTSQTHLNVLSNLGAEAFDLVESSSFAKAACAILCSTACQRGGGASGERSSKKSVALNALALYR
jgi:hypothetical protein